MEIIYGTFCPILQFYNLNQSRLLCEFHPAWIFCKTCHFDVLGIKQILNDFGMKKLFHSCFGAYEQAESKMLSEKTSVKEDGDLTDCNTTEIV